MLLVENMRRQNDEDSVSVFYFSDTFTQVLSIASNFAVSLYLNEPHRLSGNQKKNVESCKKKVHDMNCREGKINVELF